MQNLVLVMCSGDVEAVFIKGKTVLSANYVVFVFSVRLVRRCKHKGSKKVLWLKQRYLMSFAAQLF